MQPSDLNSDGVVDVIDLSILVSRWGSSDVDADINGDGIVDALDLSVLVSDWGAMGSGGGTVLLVVEEAEAGTGNLALRDLLLLHNYEVIMRGLNEPEDYNGIDVVVVSRPGGEDLGQYLHPPVGVVAIDSGVRLGMGASVAWATTASLEVVDTASPLAAGVTGTFAPFTATATAVWETSTLPAAANTVVTRPSAPNDKVIYSYEAGSSMVTRFATTRHVYIGYNRNGLAVLSNTAQAQILAAVEWVKASSFVAPPAPAPPTGLQATAGDGQVLLSWTAAVGASTYNVKRATTSGGPYTTIQSELTATGFTDTNLTNGTTYYYVVSAVNDVGESLNSSQASATPVAPEPEPPSEITHGTELTLADVGLTNPNVLTTVSGQVVSTHDGQVIENLHVVFSTTFGPPRVPADAIDKPAISIAHNDVTVRNCHVEADGPSGCVKVEPGTTGALIEHCLLDGMSPMYGSNRTVGDPDNANQGNYGIWMAAPATARRCFITGVRSANRTRVPGCVVQEQWVDYLHRNWSGVSMSSVGTYRGTTASNPPWVIIERNRMIAGSSAGVTMYPWSAGGIKNVLVQDNLVVGVGDGFGLYGGRSFTDLGHYCGNANIRIEGNRFEGTFAYMNSTGEGTNAGVDLSRPGNTFNNNRWLPGHGTITGDLPARCGVSQNACEGPTCS